MEISLFPGDIADAPAEAVCTSTNPRLTLIMGTGAAVRERGGFEIARECEALVAAAGGELRAGSAHVTTAGRLPFRAVIHCVASDRRHLSSLDVIRACVRAALARADALGIQSLAMPVFGNGHARIRFAQSLATIVETLRASTTNVERVVLVIYDADRLNEARAMVTQFMPRADAASGDHPD